MHPILILTIIRPAGYPDNFAKPDGIGYSAILIVFDTILFGENPIFSTTRVLYIIFFSLKNNERHISVC